MISLRYTKWIDAQPDTVYRLMLGLDDKSTYEKWTEPFNPTSTYEGTWEEGSNMHFIGTAEDGSEGGMVALITRNDPGKKVSIKPLGILEERKEKFDGPEAAQWEDTGEHYIFLPKDGGTQLEIVAEMPEGYTDFMNKAWNKALDIVKQMAEQTG